MSCVDVLCWLPSEGSVKPHRSAHTASSSGNEGTLRAATEEEEEEEDEDEEEEACSSKKSCVRSGSSASGPPPPSPRPCAASPGPSPGPCASSPCPCAWAVRAVRVSARRSGESNTHPSRDLCGRNVVKMCGGE